MARCYHRLCDRHFGGQTAFDRHLRLLRQPPWVVCLDPAEIGLQEGRDGWGVATTRGTGEVPLEADPYTNGRH